MRIWLTHYHSLSTLSGVNDAINIRIRNLKRSEVKGKSLENKEKGPNWRNPEKAEFSLFAYRAAEKRLFSWSPRKTHSLCTKKKNNTFHLKIPKLNNAFVIFPTDQSLN